MAQEITSSANPVIKRMRLLADRKHRRREGAFVVEGIQPVWQAVEAGAVIDTLVVAPRLLEHSPAARMVAQQEARGVTITRVSKELFGRLSGRDRPSGLAAIVRGRPAGLGELEVDAACVFVALHEIASPGNLGTIIRTANAAAAAGVILLGATADPFDPAAVKASMGALFGLPVAHVDAEEEFFAWAAGHSVAVIATSGKAADSFWDVEYPRPSVLLLGAEGTGLPGRLLERGDLLVRIPMAGTAESLNLAVAAGVMLYEMARRAGLPGTGPARA